MVREGFKIISCKEDIKIMLVETMLLDEAKEWWFTLREDLTKEARQN